MWHGRGMGVWCRSAPKEIWGRIPWVQICAEGRSRNMQFRKVLQLQGGDMLFQKKFSKNQCTLFDVDLLNDGLAERLLNTEKAGGNIFQH